MALYSIMSENGVHVTDLQDIDVDLTVADMRNLISQKINSSQWPTSFQVLFRKSPLSSKQEGTVRVKQVASLSSDSVPGGSPTFEVKIKFDLTERPKEVAVKRTPLEHKKDEKAPTSHVVYSPKVRIGASGDKLFEEQGDVEENTVLFAVERQEYWNSLAIQINAHPVYRTWSLQEKRGVIDTEWTIKLNDLLKVEADRYLRDESERSLNLKSLCKNLDKMEKAEFERNACYRRIERLNRTTIKDENIKADIQKEENLLHDLFTTLKRAQADLIKSLHHIKKSESSSAGEYSDVDNSLADRIDDLEVHDLAEEIKREDEVIENDQ